MELGARFWLWLLGATIAVVLGAGLLFLLIGAAWYAWGVLGAVVFVGVLMLALGWVHDRHRAHGGTTA